jgi:diketogulonate reductase-like aldo/keto reductase
VRTSGVPRDDLFVSTKLAAEIKDYDGAAAAIDGSLEKLGLDHIDLMLIHSPQPWDDFRGGDYAEGNREAWRALEDAHRAGRIRSIGVSNFQQSDLENILSGSTVVPHVTQLLVHAGNTPSELLAWTVLIALCGTCCSATLVGPPSRSRQIRSSLAPTRIIGERVHYKSHRVHTR